MSIWGKVIGGVAGFAIGGPVGAILGAVAGHVVDRQKEEASAGPVGTDARQVAFTTAVIVLCAKMAKADGQVTRDEVDAFKELFHIPPGEMGNVGKLFDEARQEASGFEPYAQQMAMMFSHDPAVLEELMGALFHIAKADGHVHPKELEFLQKTAAIFGFHPHHFERMRAIFLGAGDETDPFEILGVSRDASNEDIKRTYRKLSRENHPDALMAKGVPQEFIDLANEKMAAINTAYDKIAKLRGLK